MTKAYDERIDKLLQSAERHSRCLARPRDNALRRALIYRSKHANEAPIYSPHDGLYIRKDYWDSLCRSDQVLHMVKALSHIHPQWIFDSYTAAVIRGWNVPYALLDDIHIVMPYHYRTARIVRFSHGDVCNLAYFKQLLDAYGVPRDPTPKFADSLAIETNTPESIDEMPPLECYEDLIALHRC